MRGVASSWVVLLAAVSAHDVQRKAHALASHEDLHRGNALRAHSHFAAYTPLTSLAAAVPMKDSKATPAFRSARRAASAGIWSVPLNNMASAPAASTSQKPVHVTIDARILWALGATLFLLLLVSVVVGKEGAGSSTFAVIGFVVASSMMLVMNKLAITDFSYPVTLLTMQLLSCATGVRIVGLLGYIEVEPLRISLVLAFGPIPFAFLATLWANIGVLGYANMETIIMFQSAMPFATSILDWLFLGRELPDRCSTLALLVVFLGGAGYMFADSSFEICEYSWLAIWLAISLFDQVYIKHVISTLPMSSWTRVYYTNALAVLPALVWALVAEWSAVAAPVNSLTDWPRTSMASEIRWEGDPGVGALLFVLSCALFTAMSYFAFRARDAFSATGFTVAGTASKVLSVLVTVAFWEKHATSLGFLSLSLCMAASACYKSSPLRAERTQEEPKNSAAWVDFLRHHPVRREALPQSTARQDLKDIVANAADIGIPNKAVGKR